MSLMTLRDGGRRGGAGGTYCRHLGGLVALGGAGLAATHAKQANFVGGGGGKCSRVWRLGWQLGRCLSASARAGLAGGVAAGGGALLIVNVIFFSAINVSFHTTAY